VAYIVLPIARDVASAEEMAFDVFRAQWPDWEPRDADGFTILGRMAAQLYADVAVLATRMGEEGFRYYGRTVAGIVPVDATPATGTVTFTAVDTDGPYDVPEDLEISGRGSGGEPVGFRVVSPVTIENGSLTAVADVEALIEGTGGNSISGAAELEEYLTYIESATFDNPTAGGTDAESDADYLDHLAEAEQLAEPKPVLLEEFATMARWLGAYRATAINGLDPTTARNERQSISVSGTPTAGTATVTLPAPLGGTTAPIAYNASNATVLAAFEALAAILPGDIKITGGPLPAAITVEFAGQYERTNIGLMTVADSITGGDMVVVAVENGAAATTGEVLTVAVAMIDEAGEPDADAEDIAATLQSMREQNFAVHKVIPSYTTIDVTATGTAYPGWDPAVVGEAVAEAVARRLSPAYHGIREDTGEVRVWLNRTVVPHSSIVEAVQNVEGLDKTLPVTVTIGRQGTVLGTADVMLNGLAPLPRPGTISATVAAGT
jgi:hypothetical protein